MVEINHKGSTLKGNLSALHEIIRVTELSKFRRIFIGANSSLPIAGGRLDMSNLPRSSAINYDVSRINPMQSLAAVAWCGRVQCHPQKRWLHPREVVRIDASAQPNHRRSARLRRAFWNPTASAEPVPLQATFPNRPGALARFPVILRPSYSSYVIYIQTESWCRARQ